MRTARKVGELIATALLSAGLLALILWFTVPRVLGWQGQVVLTGSMEPAMPTGAVVFIERVQPAALKIGDIVTFPHPSDPSVRVTHRIVRIDSDGRTFQTKGDANGAEDDWSIPLDAVIGRVVVTVPHVGSFTRFAASRSGFLSLILVPAALISVGEVRSIIREVAANRRRPSAEETAREQ